MTVLVVDARRLAEVLARAGEDEPVIAIDPSAERLEQLMHEVPDARVLWLIGDGEVLPLPDESVDEVVGDANEDERRRVLRP